MNGIEDIRTGYYEGIDSFHCEECDLYWKAPWSSEYGMSNWESDVTDCCPECEDKCEKYA